MTIHTPASVTAASNGTRYSSRKARSDTSDEMVWRSCSWSLATKCFTHADTPADCTPVMYPTAMRAVRWGSSPKHSKLRPASGVRCRLTVGASNTLAERSRTSSARAAPARCSSWGSQVAAMDVGQGSTSDGVPDPISPAPRAPTGPSVTLMAPMPSRVIRWLCHMPNPATTSAASATVSSPTSWSTTDGMATRCVAGPTEVTPLESLVTGSLVGSGVESGMAEG